MKTLGNNAFKAVVLVIVLGQLSGCVSIIKSAVLSAWPTFEETERAWPELTSDIGRVVMYWPARSLGETVLWGPSLATVEVEVDGDEEKLGILGNETFIFVDLTPGLHDVDFIYPGPFWTTRELAISLNVRSGEIIYLKIHEDYEDLPVVVNASEAREALTEIHHNYDDPVPFTQQEEARRTAI